MASANDCPCKKQIAALRLTTAGMNPGIENHCPIPCELIKMLLYLERI